MWFVMLALSENKTGDRWRRREQMVASRSQEDDDRSGDDFGGDPDVSDEYQAPDKALPVVKDSAKNMTGKSLTTINGSVKTNKQTAKNCILRIKNLNLLSRNIVGVKGQVPGDILRKRSRSARSGGWLSSTRRTPSGTRSASGTTPSTSSGLTPQDAVEQFQDFIKTERPLEEQGYKVTEVLKEMPRILNAVTIEQLNDKDNFTTDCWAKGVLLSGGSEKETEVNKDQRNSRPEEDKVTGDTVDLSMMNKPGGSKYNAAKELPGKDKSDSNLNAFILGGQAAGAPEVQEDHTHG